MGGEKRIQGFGRWGWWSGLFGGETFLKVFSDGNFTSCFRFRGRRSFPSSRQSRDEQRGLNQKHAISPPTHPHRNQEPENPAGILQYLPPASIAVVNGNSSSTAISSTNSSTTSIFASIFASAGETSAPQGTSFSDMIGAMSRTDRAVAAEPPSLCLATNGPASIFCQPAHERRQFATPSSPSPHMSATALLQKAAQMGATASNSSFLRGFGLTTSSTSGHDENGLQWRHHQQPLEPEPPMLAAGPGPGPGPGLGLGLSYQSNSVLPELMMGPSSLLGPKPAATLDFLGLGMGPGGSATGGLSALITSIGGGLDVGASSPGRAWEAPERKPSSSPIL